MTNIFIYCGNNKVKIYCGNNKVLIQFNFTILKIVIKNVTTFIKIALDTIIL